MAIVRGLRVVGVVNTYVVGVIVLSRIGLPLIYALPLRW